MRTHELVADADVDSILPKPKFVTSSEIALMAVTRTTVLERL